MSTVERVIPRHPAKWSQSVLVAIARIVHEEAQRLDRPVSVIDPYAGVGTDRLADALTLDVSEVVGVELEPEWAAASERTIVGNAGSLPFPAARFDAAVSSVSYGNRMADHHEAKDACRTCGGSGAMSVDVDEVTLRAPCKACDGVGLTRRNTYRHALGRPLTGGSTAAMPWGEVYRTAHVLAYREMARVVRPGGMVVLNVSNFIKDGREVLASEWHVNQFLRLGCRIHEVRRVPTPRNGFGANGDLRVDGELVAVFHTPS